MVSVFPLRLLETGTVFVNVAAFSAEMFSFGCVDIQHQDLTVLILRATSSGGES